MKKVIKQILEKIGFVPLKTRVQNDCGVPILLIPYIARNGENPKTLDIKDKLAKKFEVGVPKEVDSTTYDLGDCHCQIYFLLRTGRKGDKRDIKTILKEDYKKGVTREEGEKRYMHTHLSNKSEVHLRFDKKGKVIGLEDDAGQASNVSEQAAARTRIASEAEYLKGIAELLKVVVESLQEREKVLRSGSGS